MSILSIKGYINANGYRTVRSFSIRQWLNAYTALDTRVAMEEQDLSVVDRFTKNPDGTWTCDRAASLKVGNRTIAVSQGMSFTKGEPYLFVDVAEWLDEHSN